MNKAASARTIPATWLPQALIYFPCLFLAASSCVSIHVIWKLHSSLISGVGIPNTDVQTVQRFILPAFQKIPPTSLPNTVAEFPVVSGRFYPCPFIAFQYGIHFGVQLVHDREHLACAWQELTPCEALFFVDQIIAGAPMTPGT